MFEQIKSILIDELGVEDDVITLDAELRGNLGVSSLEFLNVIIALEDAFSISMDPDRLVKMNTVGDVVSYIESLVKE